MLGFANKNNLEHKVRRLTAVQQRYFSIERCWPEVENSQNSKQKGLYVMDDAIIDLRSARALRTVDASEWINQGVAHFLEWSHEHEQSRALGDIIQGCKGENWPQFIRPGCTCIDIGAHAGDTAIPMALFAFDKEKNRPGKVIAIEPNPALHNLLTANLTLNGHFADFRLEKCAITQQDMLEIELADHGNNNCNGGIIADYSPKLKEKLISAASTTYKANGRSLSSIIESHISVGKAFELQFIKTDCEGYDKEILKSSRTILEQIKPTLYVEWFAWFTPEDDADFFSTINEIGYKPYHPSALRPLQPGERTFDVICLHQSRIGDFT